MLLFVHDKSNDGKSKISEAFRESGTWCEPFMTRISEDHSRAAGDEPCRMASVKVPGIQNALKMQKASHE
ncbi:MAG: hypothetical protein J6U42_07845 [Lachnospiraceae bacterium]|nr:hypothetical protein [Lachnospiraceae bacterium]